MSDFIFILDFFVKNSLKILTKKFPQSEKVKRMKGK